MDWQWQKARRQKEAPGAINRRKEVGYWTSKNNRHLSQSSITYDFLIGTVWIYQDAITNYLKLGGLKQKEFIFSQFRIPEDCNSSVRATPLCRLWGRSPSSPLPGSGDCHHPLLCGGFTSASASVVTLLPAFCLSQVSPCFSPIRTGVQFRAHPE